MKMLLPNKWLLIIAIILSLIAPFHYVVDSIYPPQDKAFVGYPDDALMLTLMNSVNFHFNDPWGFNDAKVWYNPLIGAVYLFILIGTLPAILHINLFVFFVLLKFLFGIVYYLVVYNLICEFIKDSKHRDIAFAIFMLAAGLGGILYIISSVVFAGSKYLPVLGYAFTREFDELSAVSHSLTHIFRIYYVIPETFGYLSILFLARKKTVLSGLALGLAFLFYPMHGVAFAIILLLYSLVTNFDRFSATIKKTFHQLLPVYLIVVPFIIPWLVHQTQQPYYFIVTKNSFEALPLLNILISFFFGITFAAYYFYKNPVGIMKDKKFIASFLLFSVLLLLEGLHFTALTSPIFTEWLKAIGMYGLINLLYSFSPLIEGCAVALCIVMVFYIMKSSASREIKFFASWMILLVFLSAITPENIGRIFNTVRFAPSLIFPISILASYGLIEFSKNFHIKHTRILILIVVLSLPSLVGYNLWLYRSAHSDNFGAFLSNDEYSALKFLKAEPEGRVFSSMKYSIFIPYYSDKYAFSFTGRIGNGGLIDEVFYTTNEFFNSTTTVQQREVMLEKYNIRYVIIGPDDNTVQLPENLKEISGGTVKIYSRY